jgi:hypothetical protein
LKADLYERLIREAQQGRVCGCGFEREYRRVWRLVHDTWVGGRILGPGLIRGAMQLVCFGCHPEFVVNPYERDHP